MAIEFLQAGFPPLENLSVAAPDGAVIGIVGEDGAGKRSLLRLAAEAERPASGQVRVRGTARLLGPSDPWEPGAADALLLDHALAERDALVRARAAIDIERLRRVGGTVLIVSHEDALLLQLCDEIWWLDRGRLAAKGDPGETLDRYQRHIARRLRESSEAVAAMAPSLRRGDGRASVLGVETLDAERRPTTVWQGGEEAAVRVTVRFAQPVADPVVGIMIRNRIGLEVYGTNTGIERLQLGPRQAGDTIAVTFSFPCPLCPQVYTLTAASHDPDGVWHDWLEDAVLVSVADSRHAAGVVNLRARVSVETA
ncbi:MAG: Wzt carbohydrate-binding domain-containing protein [Bryobacteraceae bacterium]|jgi:lipopolysaccharide transport system ATP-binding protein